MFLNHPVSLRIIIFIQVIIIALICGLISNKFWFSYILFLVIIGGLLILFLYITNVASNEKFKPSKYVKILLILFSLTIIPLLILDKFYRFSVNSLWFLEYNNQLIETILIKFYNYPSIKIIIIIIIFLILTIIIAVKITNIKKGALRQKY